MVSTLRDCSREDPRVTSSVSSAAIQTSGNITCKNTPRLTLKVPDISASIASGILKLRTVSRVMKV